MIRTGTILAVLFAFAGTSLGDMTDVSQKRDPSGQKMSKSGDAKVASTQPARLLSPQSESDVEALLSAAQDAAAENRTAEVEKLCHRILTLDPHNPQAIKLLGKVNIAGKWMTFEEAFNWAMGKIRDGQTTELLSTNVLIDMLSLAGRNDERCATVGELLGRSQLRASHFRQAAATFDRLADLPVASAYRYKTISGVLTDNPDGIYVISNAYPAQSLLLGKPQGALHPGPINLSHPLAFDAVINQKASDEIDKGEKLEEKGNAVATANPKTADDIYQQAELSYLRADNLVADSSKLQRIALTSKRIKIIDERKQTRMAKLNDRINRLGTAEMSADQYNSELTNLRKDLDSIIGDVQQSVRLAETFADEFSAQLAAADQEMTRLKRLSETLMAESAARDVNRAK